MAFPSLLPFRPPTTSNSVSSTPEQLSHAQSVMNFLQRAKNMLDCPVPSPSITTQTYTRSIVTDNLTRAPIKNQRHQQQSSGRDDMAGLPSNSRGKSHQSSSLTKRMEKSFTSSMASSLPSVPNKTPSVPTSPPKRNSMGSSHHGDIVRLPHGQARAPESLLAYAYGPSRFYSSLTGTKTSSSGRNSHDGTSGRRDSGCQRNSLDEKKAEPVVVIDEDEGEHAQNNSRRQKRLNEASRESRKVPPDSSKQVADGKREGRDSGVSFEHQKKADCIVSLLREKIPSLQNLKAHPPRSPLKLKRSGNKEREDTKTAPAAPVYVSAGEPTGCTGMCSPQKGGYRIENNLIILGVPHPLLKLCVWPALYNIMLHT